MKRLLCFLAICLLFGCGKGEEATIAPKPSGGSKCKVFLAGDSTCAPKTADKRPMYGWGEKLAGFLDDYKVDNRAVGGKSTKTYISGGQWGKLLKSVVKGDVVLIQFGHNDQNQTAEDGRGTTPDEFYTNLCKFVTETRNKDAVPVILTPICRCLFSEGSARHTHGEYLTYAKKAATDSKAVLLDIEQLTWEWLDNLGEEDAKLRYMVSSDDTDTTHLNELGANEVAQIIAKALKDCGDPVLSKLAK